MDKKLDEDAAKWAVGRYHLWVGAVFLVLGIYYLFQVATGEPSLWSIVRVAFYLVTGGLALSGAATKRVTATEDGLVVRREFWRQTFVPWNDVVDIRSEKERPGYALAIFTSDGSIIRTGLHPVENRSLPRHWQAVTTARSD